MNNNQTTDLITDERLERLASKQIKELLIPIPGTGVLGTGQYVQIKEFCREFQIAICEYHDCELKPVTGPGFKISTMPSARIDFDNDMIVVFEPARIGWIGYSGNYGTGPNSGSLVFAAQVAEDIAAIINNTEGHRAEFVLYSTQCQRDEIIREREQRHRADEIRKAEMHAAIENAEVLRGVDPTTVKVKFVHDNRPFNFGTLDLIVNEAMGLNRFDAYIVQMQLKPRGRWQTLYTAKPIANNA